MTTPFAVRAAFSSSLNRLLTEYYRCPGPLAEFELTGSEPGANGYFGFGPDTVCWGRASRASIADHASRPLHDLLDHVAIEPGTVRLPIDVHEVVDNLRHERYPSTDGERGGRLSDSWMLRQLYYQCFRPFLPVGIRKHLQRMAFRGWKRVTFPRWPVDATVEQIFERLLIVTMRAARVSRLPFIWFWPDGATSAVLMTHDVESPVGRDFCSEMMQLDESAGIRAAFGIIPEKRYSVSEALLDEIRGRGFEVTVHDLAHDGSVFSRRRTFLRSVARINEYGRRFHARGFRSGSLYRNQQWYAALDFSYDMSIPSTGRLEAQRGGCCSIMPFFIGNILELPVTTTQDYSLFHVLNDYSIDLWTHQLTSIIERHGLASFIVHPDYTIEPRARRAYTALLEEIARARDRQNVWVALPGDIDRWWRQRRRMTLVPDGDGWRIEGQGKERAAVAFATLDGDRLRFTLDGHITQPTH